MKQKQFHKLWLLAAMSIMPAASAWAADASVGTAAELKSAIEAIADGETITLTATVKLNDVGAVITCPLNSGESFTLALGSFSITKGNYSIALNDGVSVNTSKTVTAGTFTTAVEGKSVCVKRVAVGYSYTSATAYLKDGSTSSANFHEKLSDAFGFANKTFFYLLNNIELNEDLDYANGTSLTLSGNYTITNGEYKIYLNQDVVGKVTNENDNLFATRESGLSLVKAIDGSYTTYSYVNPKEAKIGDTEYETFAAAANAATNSDVIVLLRKVSTAYQMTADKVLNVQLNGYTLSKPLAPEGAYYVKSTKEGETTTYSVIVAGLQYTNVAGTSVTYYEKLTASSISSDGTYKLLDDVTLTARLAPTILVSSVTLDLNGHTFTSQATDEAILLSRAGSSGSEKKFSIIDSSVDKGGKIIVNSSAQYAAIQVQGNYNNLTIGEGVTIEGKGVALLNPGVTLTVKGTINAGNDIAVATNGSTTTSGTINIEDGAVLTSNSIAMYLPGNTVTNITGGTITGSTGIYAKSGTLNITGGTIIGTGAANDYSFNGNGANSTGDAVVIDNCGYPCGAPTVNVTGGTFASNNADPIASYVKQDDPAQSEATEVPVTGFVSGGTFSSQLPANVVDDAFICPSTSNGEGGTFTLTTGSYAATVDDYGYETFLLAVSAAGGSKVVTLLANVADAYTMAADETLMVALNGFTLTVNAPATYTLLTSEASGTTTYTLNLNMAEVDYVLTESVPYTFTEDTEVKSVSYSLAFGSERVNKYQGWFLPFDYTITAADLEKFKFYKIDMIAHSSTKGGEVEDANLIWIFLAKVNEGELLKANKPYVYVPLEEVDYTFSAANATLKAKTSDVTVDCSTTTELYQFYGVYENTSPTETNKFYYMNIDGEVSWGDGTGSVTVGPYRWIMTVTAKNGEATPASYARSIRFTTGNGEGDATGIQNVSENNSEIDGYFTLDGVKVGNPENGVYLMRLSNGNVKKVFVK